MRPEIPIPPLWPKLPAPPASSGTADPSWRIPSDARCRALWDRYEMPAHIRAHSEQVALVATQVAEAGFAAGVPVEVRVVRASALLHDLAKIYCIHHGGSHSQLGGAWVMALTGNPLIAQGVIHHVSWPFELDARRFFAPLCVLYADKRVAHDRIVPLESRFDDLIDRYGKTEEIRGRIRSTNRQAKEIEDALARLVEKNLNAHDFNRGRLVD
jgi:hypothetical protein